MTARRMAHTTSNSSLPSELNRTHHVVVGGGKLNPINATQQNNANPASSYQTATPQQLQAAGIQPIVINDRNNIASTTTIVRQQPLPQPSSYQSNRHSTSVSIPNSNSNAYHEYGSVNHNKSSSVKPLPVYGSAPPPQQLNRFGSSNNRSDILLTSELHNIGHRKSADLNSLQVRIIFSTIYPNY